MPLIKGIAQGTPEWIQARVGCITASMAAACLRIDPGRSAASAWREIMGTEKIEVNHWMEQGIQGEPLARNAYECLTGELVRKGGFWVHPSIPWLKASPDGLVGADGLVEIKVPRSLPLSVSHKYRVQCLVQLIVTERSWCDLFCWTPNDGHFLQRVHLAGEAGLIRRLKEFYDTYVTTNVEPPRKARKKKSA